MLQNILNLEGAHELSKKQQKDVQGGKEVCDDPVFSHIEAPGEGAINGGQGGIVYTQNCTTKIFGIVVGRRQHEFSSLIPL